MRDTEEIIAEITSDINSVLDNESFLPIIKKHISSIGAENFFFGTVLFHDLKLSPELCVINNYPSEWQQRYEEKNYFEKDLTVSHCKQKSIPIVWPVRDKNISTINKKIFSESAEFGLKSGISLPFHASHGEHGALAVSTSVNYKSSALSNPENLFVLQILGATLFDYFRLKKSKTVELTQREKECLKWVAAGKTTWEISRIIGISERTVVFHIQNSISKTRTTSRTSATVVAILNNQIVL